MRVGEEGRSTHLESRERGEEGHFGLLGLLTMYEGRKELVVRSKRGPREKCGQIEVLDLRRDEREEVYEADELRRRDWELWLAASPLRAL